MLDAGHGDHDAGAVGPSGLREKDVALTVTLLLGAILVAGGMDVRYTRKDDTFLALTKRCEIANAAGVDAFLSIHCNSAANDASGFEVWTSPGQTKSDPFATSLFVSYGDAWPDLKKRADLGDGDPDKEAKFAVLTGTKMMAALFELEFIQTHWGENFLRDRDNQRKMAQAIANGILKHFGLASGTVPQPPDLRSEVKRLGEDLRTEAMLSSKVRRVSEELITLGTK